MKRDILKQSRKGKYRERVAEMSAKLPTGKAKSGTTWGESWKANFTWNMNVKMFLDGEQVTGVVKVKDTHYLDDYDVDHLFGFNKVTNVYLVSR